MVIGSSGHHLSALQMVAALIKYLSPDGPRSHCWSTGHQHRHLRKGKGDFQSCKNCRWMAKMPAASHMRNGTPLSPLDHGMGSGGRADQRLAARMREGSGCRSTII
jgi:hypothetical protein